MSVQTYFLGANTAEGFFSCYDDFCVPEEGNFLWVLKGGPGCGKSTFMRAMGRAAEERGLDVEYVLCSGDPDSLDGVYIPALRLGYVDGTAPHRLDVPYPAIRGAYLDLGRFYDAEGLRARDGAMLALFGRYRECYAAAYRALAAAPCPLPPSPVPAGRRRFCGAVSCKGILWLPMPEGSRAVTPGELTGPAETVLLHPLWPRLVMGLRAPGEAGYRYTELPMPDCTAALTHLREAKALHDALESQYHPYVDFDGVAAEARRHIEKYLQNPLSTGEK